MRSCHANYAHYAHGMDPALVSTRTLKTENNAVLAANNVFLPPSAQGQQVRRLAHLARAPGARMAIARATSDPATYPLRQVELRPRHR